MTDKTDTQSDAERAREWLLENFGIGDANIYRDDWARPLAAEFAAVRAEERERIKADMVALSDAAGSLEVNGFCLALLVRIESRAAAIRRGE